MAKQMGMGAIKSNPLAGGLYGQLGIKGMASTAKAFPQRLVAAGSKWGQTLTTTAGKYGQRFMGSLRGAVAKGAKAGARAEAFAVGKVGNTAVQAMKGLAHGMWKFLINLAFADKLKDVFDIALWGPDCGRGATVFVAGFVPGFAESLVHQTENVQVFSASPDEQPGHSDGEARGHEQWLKESLRDLEQAFVWSPLKKIGVMEKLEAAAKSPDMKMLREYQMFDPDVDPEGLFAEPKIQLENGERRRNEGDLVEDGLRAAHQKLIGFVQHIQEVDINGDPDENASFDEVVEFYDTEKQAAMDGGASEAEATVEAGMRAAVAWGADIFNNYVGPNGDICEGRDIDGSLPAADMDMDS
jgi:hypothetical protein